MLLRIVLSSDPGPGTRSWLREVVSEILHLMGLGTGVHVEVVVEPGHWLLASPDFRERGVFARFLYEWRRGVAEVLLVPEVFTSQRALKVCVVEEVLHLVQVRSGHYLTLQEWEEWFTPLLPSLTLELLTTELLTELGPEVPEYSREHFLRECTTTVQNTVADLDALTTALERKLITPEEYWSWVHDVVEHEVRCTGVEVREWGKVQPLREVGPHLLRNEVVEQVLKLVTYLYTLGLVTRRSKYFLLSDTVPENLVEKLRRRDEEVRRRTRITKIPSPEEILDLARRITEVITRERSLTHLREVLRDLVDLIRSR